MNVNDMDREVQAAVFASRVALCKKTEPEVIADALAEWKKALKWAASPSLKDGSFLWFADEFDIEPSAIRRAIVEKRK